MKNTIRILYKDEALAVAVKPSGILSQPDRTGEDSMISLLKEQLGREVFPVHRLDRAVGGVMVFALTGTAAGKLSGMLGTDGFEKDYMAVIHGTPAEESGEFSDYLYHDPRRNFTSVVAKGVREAKEARLAYNLIAQDMEKEFSLVHIHLYTGRTHQIRVQFSSRGMPVAGDGKYGAHDRMGLSLWSYRLSFRHPIRKKMMAFSALPDGNSAPWDRFSL